METLLSLAASREVLSGVLAAVFSVAYIYAAQRVLLLLRRQRLERQKEIRSVIAEGFRSGTLSSIEDFVNVYRGVLQLGGDDTSHRAGLARALREYIVDVVADESADKSERLRLKGAASVLLERLESDSPFADLPAAERNLLRDIDGFSRAGEHERASAKLQDLAGLIEARQDAMNRLQSLNKWAVPLAMVGVMLTIIFGLASIFR